MKSNNWWNPNSLSVRGVFTNYGRFMRHLRILGLDKVLTLEQRLESFKKAQQAIVQSDKERASVTTDRVK